MAEAEITFDIRKIKFLILLIFLGFVAFLELSLTFNSPIAFGDEALHTSISRWIGTHIDYPIYMPQIGTNIFKVGFFRSPLFNILQGSFYFLFGFNETIAKFLVPFIAILTSLTVYLLVNKLYSQDVAIISSIVTMTIPSFVTYSVLLYSDVLLTYFFAISILSTFLALKTNRRKYLFLGGITAGLSILADASGFIVIPFYAFAFLYHLFKKRNFVQTIEFWSPAILVFLIIVAPYFIRNEVYYKTPVCQFPGFLNSVGCNLTPTVSTQYQFEGVLSASQNIEFLSSGIINYLNFAYGIVFLVPLFLFAGIILALYRREETDVLLILALIAFVLIFYQSFKGRTEDMARNLVASTPLVALLAALYLNQIGDFLKKYSKHLIWIVLFFVLAISFFNARDKINSLISVKQFIPSFFEACKWVQQNLPENATLMSFNTAPTVYNCNRQAQWDFPDSADVILSQNVTLAKEKLRENGFTYIFVQKFSITPQKISGGYWSGFVDMLSQNPIDFKVVFENGPSYGSQQFVQCINTAGCDPGEVIYQIVY